MSIVFAPLVETFLLVKLVQILKRRISSTWLLCAVCGAIWGVLHGVSAPLWGVSTLFSFIVMTYLFLHYQSISTTAGAVAALTTHVMVNSVAVVTQLI